MRPVNSHDACCITPRILPPAFAEGAERGPTAQLHGAGTFVDAAPHDDPETVRHHALWRAVISQQLMDAKNISQKHEKQLRKKEAIEWLFHNACDFSMVCDLAGWEPDYVRSLCVTAQAHGFRRITQGKHV